MHPHLKAAMLTYRPLMISSRRFGRLMEGVSEMPGYEAIAWGVALSAGVLTVILASTALIAS
jgi:hypothetical protein